MNVDVTQQRLDRYRKQTRGYQREARRNKLGYGINKYKLPVCKSCMARIHRRAVQKQS